MFYAVKSVKTWTNEIKTIVFVDKDEVLTTKEAVNYLKISKPTYLKDIRLGRIKAVKGGSGWRVHRSELHRFLRVGGKEVQTSKTFLSLSTTRHWLLSLSLLFFLAL